MAKIKEDVFWDEYKPIKNHLVKDASYDGCMFETYGEEKEFVAKQHHKKIWTIVDAEGELVIIAGWHFVNRMGYLITEKEWDNEDDEVEEED